MSVEPVTVPATVPKQEELPMVALSGQSDGTYDDGRRSGSSTEFFAIPHANRAKAPGPTAVSAPAAPAARAVAPMGGPVPMGPVPVGGIQGPVAVGPMGGGGGAYGVVDPNLDDGRTQSYRVFGVVISLVVMVCLALLVTVGLVVVAVLNQTPPEEPITQQTVAPPVAPPINADTGGPKVAPDPKPARRPRPAKPKSTGPSQPRPAKPKAEDPANGGGPAGAAGTVTIRIPPGIYVSSFEVSCQNSDSFRARGTFVGQTATVPNVPAGECTGRFKGGGITSKVIIRGGSANLNCSLLNAATLDCR